MLYTAKIKLTSPILGQMEDGTKVKRLEKDKEGDNIILSKEVFSWAIHESLSLLQLDKVVNPEHIAELLPFKRPTIVLYNRNYTDKISRKPKVMQFEAIRSGAALTMDMLVLNDLPKTVKEMGLRAPTEKEVRSILVTIGKFFSISPYGSTKGFGRYELLEFEPKYIKDENP